MASEVPQIGTKKESQPSVAEQRGRAEVHEKWIGVKGSGGDGCTLVDQRSRDGAMVDVEMWSEHAVRLRRGTMESWV